MISFEQKKQMEDGLRDAQPIDHSLLPNDGVERVAILVAHGMGEQVRYETLEALAAPLGEGYTVRTAKVDHEIAQRVEIATPQREVHFYESYWAPLTEGNVGVLDVLNFLGRGAWHTILRGTHFSRWVDGARRPFQIGFGAVGQLLSALGVLGALVLINFLMVAILFGQTWIAGRQQLIGDLTTLLAVISHHTAGFVLIYVAAALVKRRMRSRVARAALTVFGRIALYELVVVIVLVAWFMIIAILHHTTAGHSLLEMWATIGDSHRDLFIYAAAVALAVVLIHNRSSRKKNLARLAALTLSPLLLLAVTAASLRLYAYLPMLKPGKDPDIQPDTFSLWVRYAQTSARPPLSSLAILVVVAFIVFTTLLVFETVFHLRRPTSRLLRGTFRVTAVLAWGACIFALFLLVYRGLLFGSDHFWSDSIFPLSVPWLIVGAGSLFVKYFLVEYVGDVAAYVSGHKLDRFYKLRAEIQELVCKTFRAVYEARWSDGSPVYSRIAVVGHSLGSVIAYDSLNRIFSEDLLRAKPTAVPRTTLLLTFGSPLDKIAYIFTTQSSETAIMKEALASQVQPLIARKECREKLAWINVWSENDIISGRLDFFDGGELSKVVNIHDDEAVTPLAAHTEYWRNSAIFEVLRQWIADPDDSDQILARVSTRVDLAARTGKASADPGTAAATARSSLRGRLFSLFGKNAATPPPSTPARS